MRGTDNRYTNIAIGRIRFRLPPTAGLGFSAATIDGIQYIEHSMQDDRDFDELWEDITRHYGMCLFRSSVDGFRYCRYSDAAIALQAVGDSAVFMHALQPVPAERLMLNGNYRDHAEEARMDFGLGRGILRIAGEREEHVSAGFRVPGQWELDVDCSSNTETAICSVSTLLDEFKSGGLRSPSKLTRWKGNGLLGFETCHPPHRRSHGTLMEGTLTLTCFGREDDPFYFPSISLTLRGTDWSLMLEHWSQIKSSLHSAAEPLHEARTE